MALKTAKEYRDSLRKRKPLNLYINGEKVPNPIDHPIVKPSVNSLALTYALAEKPEHKDIMTTKSSLTGEVINRFLSFTPEQRRLTEKNSNAKAARTKVRHLLPKMCRYGRYERCFFCNL